MERIVLNNRVFSKYISSNEIQKSIKELASKVTIDYIHRERPLFLCVLNGSFMFMADLMRNIDFECEISFIKMSSYLGTSSTGEIKEIIGLSASIEGRNVIVVEDIVDSGATISSLLNSLKGYKPATIEVATLLFKPNVYREDILIKYVGLEIPDDFIVGYGLDYDELGRNLNDIYKIVE